VWSCIYSLRYVYQLLSYFMFEKVLKNICNNVLRLRERQWFPCSPGRQIKISYIFVNECNKLLLLLFLVKSPGWLFNQEYILLWLFRYSIPSYSCGTATSFHRIKILLKFFFVVGFLPRTGVLQFSGSLCLHKQILFLRFF